MKVAVICSTYKRPKQLSEAIQCFLSQDYPGHLLEMIVLDDAGQYAPDALSGLPCVKLVTTPHRFRTLGEKRNATAAFASPNAEAYAVWDDDDIYLPWHISAGVQALANADYTIPKQLFSEKPGPRLQLTPNQYLFHGAWLFRRAAFEKVHGYPWMQSGQDQGLLHRFKAANMRRANPLEYDARPSYVYRWFTIPGNKHLSSLGKGGYERLATESMERVEKIIPEFTKDWLNLAKPHIDNNYAAVPKSSKKIICSLVVMPYREKFARQIIDTLAPQCDEVIVHAKHGFSHPRATVLHHEVLVDQLKFDVNLENVEYHFTCDDDIMYPKDYVARMIATMERHGKRRVVGVHGALMNQRINHYYRDRKIVHYEKASEDRRVHVIGTGTMCYSPETISFPKEVFLSDNLSDVHVAVHLQKQLVGASVLERPNGWLKTYPGSQSNSLFSSGSKSHSIATDIAKRVEWSFK